MKHLEPLMTYLSPLRMAVVRMPETSEQASGSVRQKEATSGASVSIPRYFFLSSSEPARPSGALARPLAPIEVAMPEQPQLSSSSISAPSKYEAPGPPYSSGVCTFIRPSSQALRRISSGQVPSRSYSQATGRISFSAKSCAISRSAFCSSVSVKSTIVLEAPRLTGQSTADERVHTPGDPNNDEPSRLAGRTGTMAGDGERLRDRAVRRGRGGRGGGALGAGHEPRLVRPDRSRRLLPGRRGDPPRGAGGGDPADARGS